MFGKIGRLGEIRQRQTEKKIPRGIARKTNLYNVFILALLN